MTNTHSLHPRRPASALRRHRGAILFVLGVLGALVGFCAADYSLRRARARKIAPHFDQQHQTALAAQKQAHAVFNAYKEAKP